MYLTYLKEIQMCIFFPSSRHFDALMICLKIICRFIIILIKFSNCKLLSNLQPISSKRLSVSDLWSNSSMYCETFKKYPKNSCKFFFVFYLKPDSHLVKTFLFDADPCSTSSSSELHSFYEETLWLFWGISEDMKELGT